MTIGIRLRLALALGLAVSSRTTGVASAQPAPPGSPPPASGATPSASADTPSASADAPPAPAATPESPPASTTTPDPVGQPVANPGPATEANRPTDVARPTDAGRPNGNRPTGLAFGIGFGYLLPTSLQTPNITSVRMRLASGLTFEPQLVLANTSDKVDGGAGTSNKQTELAIASVVHYPLRVHRKVDLELLGNAGLSTRLINPSGDNNDRTITTVDLGYGVGLGYWFTPHWNLSLSASNPLLTYARTRQEMTADNVTVTSSTTIGLVFAPDVTLMLHLFD